MRLIISIIILFFFQGIYAQQVISTIQIGSDTLRVGELDTVILTVTTSNKNDIKHIDYRIFDTIRSEINFFAQDEASLKDTDIADIEWLGQNTTEKYVPNSKEWTNEGGKMVFRKKIPIRIWDIGVFIFPPVDVAIDSSRVRQLVNLEPERVMVLFPEGVQPQDTTQMIMPIVPIMRETTSWRDYIWIAYIIGGLLLLLIGLLLYFRYMKKKNEGEEEVIEVYIPAHEKALEKLHKLDEKQLWQNGMVKDYQSELTYVIREYLENRYDIQALESTTSEIKKNLKEVEFDAQHEEKLMRILRIADLVKFAKAKPGGEIHQSFMDDAYSFIRQTKEVKIIAEDGLD